MSIEINNNKKLSQQMADISTLIFNTGMLFKGATNGKYINYQYGIELALGGVKATDYLKLPSGTSRVLYLDNGSTYLAPPDIRGLAFYDSGKTFISGNAYPHEYNLEVAVPDNAVYVRFTIGSTWTGIKCYYKGLTKVVPVFEDIINFLKSIGGNTYDFYSKLFSSIVLAGDSLTEGDYETNHSFDVRIKSYPYFFNLLTGITVLNAGVSGATATSYWGNIQTGVDYDVTNGYSGETHRRKVPTSFASYDAAVILLGQNGGLTDTLTADTANTPYSNYANTHTGNYCKIIEKMKADNPTIKIFLCAVPQNGSDNVLTNEVIKKIATKYSLPYLDLYNDCVMVSSSGAIYRPVDNIHYNMIGYLTLANTIKYLMFKYISENPAFMA